MARIVLSFIAAFFLAATPASAKVEKFPASFRTQQVKVDGAAIFVRVGGQGPAVVMLHGFADTGDMWGAAAQALYRNYTVIVPDLRGIARPGAMHATFNQFAAFNQDAIDNKVLAAKGKLPMPILALGGDKSFGTQQAEIMRLVGSNVTGGTIANSGHWIMEEQPAATVKLIRDFLDKK